MQKKLTVGNLLNELGTLIEAGYSTSLVKKYDRREIKVHPLRIKEWDYYLVYCGEFGIALTLADNSYMGMVSASFLDFSSRAQHTVSPIIPLTFGKIGLPPSSAIGTSAFSEKKYSVSFTHEANGRRLKLHMEDFTKGHPLDVDLLLTDEPSESMVIATPLKSDKKAFYYNQKIVGFRASGIVKYSGKNYNLTLDSAFGILDWGRGVWTYDNTWYWSSAVGLLGERVFGFNLGYGFGDTSAASENMLFLDGKAHKISQVEFNIPKNVDGRDDYLSSWQFTSDDGRFEAKFSPIMDRVALTSLGVIMSDQHQVFGYFDGKAILDDGEVVEMNRFLGFAEKVRNKW